MPASSRRPSTCISTRTTCAWTRSRTGRSPTTRRTTPSTGSTASPPARPPCSPGRRATARPGVLGEPELATVEKGKRAYDESVQPAAHLRRLLQGPAEGRPPRPAPHAADDADAVGPGLGAGDLMPARLAEDGGRALRGRRVRRRRGRVRSGGRLRAALRGMERRALAGRGRPRRRGCDRIGATTGSRSRSA